MESYTEGAGSFDLHFITVVTCDPVVDAIVIFCKCCLSLMLCCLRCRYTTCCSLLMIICTFLFCFMIFFFLRSCCFVPPIFTFVNGRRLPYPGKVSVLLVLDVIYFSLSASDAAATLVRFPGGECNGRDEMGTASIICTFVVFVAES